MNWYLDAIKNKYATFDGRARREEFWMFTLFNTIILIVLNVVDLGVAKVIGVPLLTPIYCLATLVPGLAVGA